MLMDRRLLAVPGLLAVALLLSACGGSSSDTANQPSATATSHTSAMPATTPSSGPAASAKAHNDPDVMFATMMIPHHRQAVEMAKLAATRASAPEVKALAAKIEGAQQPEIDTMTGWLQSWGAPVPSTAMGGMSMGQGMMSESAMRALGKVSGSTFDTMFLTMMITHHQGAIAEAKTEQASGSNTDALALARKIESDQTAEISRMRALQQLA